MQYTASNKGKAKHTGISYHLEKVWSGTSDASFGRKKSESGMIIILTKTFTAAIPKW